MSIITCGKTGLIASGLGLLYALITRKAVLLKMPLRHKNKSVSLDKLSRYQDVCKLIYMLFIFLTFEYNSLKNAINNAVNTYFLMLLWDFHHFHQGFCFQKPFILSKHFSQCFNKWKKYCFDYVIIGCFVRSKVVFAQKAILKNKTNISSGGCGLTLPPSESSDLNVPFPIIPSPFQSIIDH